MIQQLFKGRFSLLTMAFVALLAAEQGRAVPLPPHAPSPPAAAASAAVTQAISEDAMEEIVRRVIDRMGTTAVQQTVLDVAERLVREEIARIKRQA